MRCIMQVSSSNPQTNLECMLHIFRLFVEKDRAVALNILFKITLIRGLGLSVNSLGLSALKSPVYAIPLECNKSAIFPYISAKFANFI